MSETAQETVFVNHLTDLVDAEAFKEAPRAALLEAALLAQRSRIAFAPGSLTVPEVEALAQAREVLELERSAVLKSAMREILAEARGEKGNDADVERLKRSLARQAGEVH